MFTGIIREVGRIVEVREGDDARRIEVRAPETARGLEVGASVAVDGACLTAAEVGGEGFVVDVIGTTLSRTVAGDYAPGRRVNLEPAMELGGRLDGHLVQGHVDGVGRVLGSRREGEHLLLDVRVPREVWHLTILHGSIALNGVSLTVNDLKEPDRCQVALIPHTRAHTNLGDLEKGARVNVEGDLIGKYVGKLVGR